MDIQTSFNSQILQAMKALMESNLNLIVGQQLVTKVTAINANGITLKWGAQYLTVENQNQRVAFTPYIGQNVTLQVVKITPNLEFKPVALDTQLYEGSPPSAEKMNAMRLTLATAPLVSRIDESLKNFVNHAQGQQPVEAKVVGLVGHKIQLELVVDDHQNASTGGKKMLISLERNQLQLLPTQTEPLKVGQALTLAITKIGSMPEFTQLSPTASAVISQEEKIASFMKQLLPRHESPAVLLNQLRTDLPQLEIKNDSLAATLKQNAAALFEHLQPHEQLFNPQKLKHLIYSSGLFFEAKSAATNVFKAAAPVPLPSSPVVQTPTKPLVDLKMPLLNLLQHTSTPNELKQLTSTLLQNLLKQEAAPTQELTQLIDKNQGKLHTQLSQLTHSESIPQSLKTLVAEILPNLKPENVTDENQRELHTQLSQLTRSESIPQSLKSLVAEILPNLKPENVTDENQRELHTQLSQLTRSESIPQSLKLLAAEILPNLKPENVTDENQRELHTQLSQLTRSESIPQSLKSLVAEILSNLKPENVTDENQRELHTQLSQLTHSESIPQSLKTLIAEILPNLKPENVVDDLNEVHVIAPPLLDVDNAPVDDSISTDFKNNLFELIHTLKQGIAQEGELALTETQVNGLQQLQNKTENALAKVVIDQLHSLPKDDGGKQVWAFELPFLMNNQAETLKMEIQRDKITQEMNPQSQHWSVNLTLTPPKLGEVQCVVSYQNGVVNTYFKNEQPRTTALISQHLENLKQQLQHVGLITGLMSAHNNFQPIKSAYSTGNTSLFNERV